MVALSSRSLTHVPEPEPAPRQLASIESNAQGWGSTGTQIVRSAPQLPGHGSAARLYHKTRGHSFSSKVLSPGPRHNIFLLGSDAEDHEPALLSSQSAALDHGTGFDDRRRSKSFLAPRAEYELPGLRLLTDEYTRPGSESPDEPASPPTLRDVSQLGSRSFPRLHLNASSESPPHHSLAFGAAAEDREDEPDSNANGDGALQRRLLSRGMLLTPLARRSPSPEMSFDALPRKEPIGSSTLWNPTISGSPPTPDERTPSALPTLIKEPSLSPAFAASTLPLFPGSSSAGAVSSPVAAASLRGQQELGACGREDVGADLSSAAPVPPVDAEPSEQLIETPYGSFIEAQVHAASVSESEKPSLTDARTQTVPQQGALSKCVQVAVRMVTIATQTDPTRSAVSKRRSTARAPIHLHVAKAALRHAVAQLRGRALRFRQCLV